MSGIRTEYWPKPIPVRSFDWMATRDDFDMGDPVGLGRTELDAVKDLIEQEMEEEDAT